MKPMNAVMILSLAVLAVLVMVDPGFAQSSPPLPAMPPPPAAAPIDGGLGLLAAAGAGYAYRKLRKKA